MNTPDRMIIALLTALGIFGVGVAADLPAAQGGELRVAGTASNVLHTLNWCTIDCPAVIMPGRPFEADVRVHDAAPDELLHADLHWLRADGSFGGMAGWGGPPRALRASTSCRFVFKPRETDGLAAFSIFVYCSTNGLYAGRTRETCTPRIPRTPREATAELFTRSWIAIGPNLTAAGVPCDTFREGDQWLLPVEYFVHPADDVGGTKLSLMALGPWLDCPDGTYATKRGHQNYPRMNATVPCVIGVKTTQVFRLTMPAPHASAAGRVGNALLPICAFQDANGQAWPWQVRGEGPWFARTGGFFRLTAATPGNLFTYAEPVVMRAVLQRGGADGARHVIRYFVYDTKDTLVTTGAVAFTARTPGQHIAMPLQLGARGTLLLEAAVDGWETQRVTFARIPDVPALTGGRRTHFGVGWPGGLRSGPRMRAQLDIARRLGLTTRRAWLRWYEARPARDEWRRLAEYRRALEESKAMGIATWLLLYDPPAWALRGTPAQNPAFVPFDFADEDLRTTVRRLGENCNNMILGWEWLNEIVPGTISKDPVGDYRRFCEIATRAAKAADSNVITMLAGGLWPRSFRAALFNCGAAHDIDVLPVHYCNGGMIAEAREDLAQAGRPDVPIWDNESALGIATWTMPWRTAMQITAQGNWIMENWTDELLHGCELIVYFGGQGEPAGDWSYLWDDLSPRPVAATLAVFVSKLHDATPRGAFRIGRAGIVHLFEKPGANVLAIVSSSDEAGEMVALPVGAGPVIVTDQQGNERRVPARHGVAHLALTPLRVFIEGADADVMKAQAACKIVSHLAPEKRTALVQTPVLTLARGDLGTIAVHARNLFAGTMAGQLEARVPAAWSTPAPVRFALPARSETTLIVRIAVPARAAQSTTALSLAVRYDQTNLPVVAMPVMLAITDPASVGNLLRNGGFETQAAQPNEVAAGWTSSAAGAARMPYDERDRGHGGFVLAFTNTRGLYAEAYQARPLAGGPSYLYTAWIKTRTLPAGSNVRLQRRDGSVRTLHDLQVFRTPPTQAEWDVFTCRLQTPFDVVSGTFAPVGKGDGWAWYDNVRLTVYEGSDFAAECHRLRQPVVIDGCLDEWDTRGPIPLMGASQLSISDPTYAWSPTNLSAAAYLRWDERGIYFAADVLDDRPHAVTTAAGCRTEDSVALALHPHNRQAGFDDSAFVYHLSAAPPGGSGKHTLYRPAAHAGGLRAGTLAKDSSVYDIAIRHDAGRTIYELFMPYSELGGIRGAHGAKAGLALVLQDNDGNGPVAAMRWGGGGASAWDPRQFGILTFTAQ